MKEDMSVFLQNVLWNKHWDYTTDKSELKEVNREKNTTMTIQITHQSTKAFVLKVPANGAAHSSMVETSSGDNQHDYRKSCDYLVFIEKNDYIDIYIIELKETLLTKNSDNIIKARKQILATVPVLEYLVSMAKIHNNESRKIKKHFVIIGDKLSAQYDKQGVKASPLSHEQYKEYGKKYDFKVIHSTTSISIEKLQ